MESFAAFLVPFEVEGFLRSWYRDELFVYGTDATDTRVLEHWRAEREGPEWESPFQAVHQRTIFRNLDIGSLHEMEVDPSGQEMWILHGSPTRLSCLRFAGGNLRPIAHGTEATLLSELIAPRLCAYRHREHGTQWLIRGSRIDSMHPFRTSQRTLLYRDENKDGEWEPHIDPNDPTYPFWAWSFSSKRR